ncbi:MAG: tetratricopeptide repeat protein [Microcystaceae cyanobacterium]
MKKLLTRWLKSIFLGIIFLSLIPLPASGNPQSEQLFKRGIEQLASHHYSAALTSFSEVINLDNQLSNLAYSNRCLTYLKLNQPQKALNDCQLSLKQQPNNQEVRLNLGLAYYRLGKYKNAVREYGKIIVSNQQDYRAYYNRGLAYSALNAYSNALEDYQQAFKSSQSLSPMEKALIYNDQGLVKIKLGNLIEAIADLTTAINLDQDNELYYYNRGCGYHQQGNYQAAITDFNQVIALNPQKAEAYFRRGWLHHNLGNQPAAIADLNLVLKYTNEEDSVYQKTIQLMNQVKKIYYQTYYNRVG